VLDLIARDETDPVIRWLMTDARKRADSSEFLDAFAHELRASGVDVARITTGVPILHPLIFSFSGLWQLGKGATERLYRSGPDFAATMSNSPILKGVGAEQEIFVPSASSVGSAKAH